MIIKAPTGLFAPILPTGPSDPGNYTFTISNESVPRSPETFVQLPASEAIRREPEPVFNKEQKRIFAGELIFDITKTSEAVTGSGVRQFEVGEVLEFSEEEQATADPYVLDDIEMRQDLKVIDFASAGLSQEEFDELQTASLKKQNEITAEIAKLGSDLKDNSASISANQANINNSQSVLENILLVLGEGSSSAEKVKNNLESLELEKVTLLSNREELQSNIDSLRDQLVKVREVVR